MRNRLLSYGSLPIMIALCILVSGCTRPTPAAEAETEGPESGTAFPQSGSGTKPEQGPPGTDAVDEAPVDGDWLVGVLPAEMESLNPFTTSDAYAARINEYVFESLLDMDNETFELIPELAASWKISEDKLSYTFKLAEGIIFSDGQPLTAHDVKFSFDKLMDPTTDAPHARNYYKDVTACEVLDDLTVRFTCSKPYFRHLMMLGGLEVIPEHIYAEGDFNNHPNNRNPVGSGPYVLERWDTGQQLVLVRNERYWGEKPHILKRVYRIITNPEAALQGLMSHEVDTMGLTPEQWITRASKPKFEEDFNKLSYNGPGYSYIGWNLRRPQFEDKRVRRALTMLLDRELIRDEIYYNLAEVTSGNFFMDEPEYDKSIKPWPFDPDTAKQLLDEAGWIDSNGDGVRDKDGRPFRFELLLTNDNPEGEQIATVFQEELAAAGIDMSIRQLEWATFLESVKGHNFDACMLGWSLPPEPDPYQVWHSSQAVVNGSNAVGFVNKEADEIIEEGRLIFDRQERVKLYHRFHAIVHEEQPYTFLFCRKALLATDKRFHNVIVYPRGPDSREWWVPLALQRYH
ncbi:MAG TPA: hypothetical protein HPP77_07985 [Candidatus Hydrogenedentes bacterium]|nr:hypothetical protein [Candidatus Hydrogenedentota bacterium]HIJ74903.1 hypothetical protein [Candidatus Hydrogenedentota bacterium]